MDVFRKEVFMIPMEIDGNIDSEGVPIVPCECTLNITQACREVHDGLGELGKFVTKYLVKFRRGDVGREVEMVSITVYFTEQNGVEPHYTRWFPYSASTEEMRPSKKEIAECVSAPLEEICKSRQT